jgi:hypothetical protein
MTAFSINALPSHFPSKYEFQDIDVPKPKGYELLIETGAAGFCHTVHAVPLFHNTSSPADVDRIKQDSMVAAGQFESMGAKCPITVRAASSSHKRQKAKESRTGIP